MTWGTPQLYWPGHPHQAKPTPHPAHRMQRGGQGYKPKTSTKKGKGRVSLSTLRERVQQAIVHARTRSGSIGVKVIISNGPLASRKKQFDKAEQADDTESV